MTRRNAARLAWSLFALGVVITAMTLALMTWSSSAELPREFGSRAGDYIDRITFLAFPVIGALITARRPENPIGWLFLLAPLVGFAGNFAGEDALRGLVVDPESLPGAAAAAWFYQWIWIWPIVLLPPLFLLFPSGRFWHRGWRWALLPPLVAGLLVTGPVAIATWEFRGRTLLIDPESIDAESIAGVLIPVSLALIAIGFLASVVSLLLRWRRSSGVERLQIKWLLLAGALVLADFIVNAFIPVSGFWRQLLSTAAFLTIPAAVGIAILRYRLYDIDRIISRTVSYGLLSAILAGGYLLAVLALQSVLPLGEDSPVIVAASTLGVIAAFGPLKARLQSLVDRRFNRSRYDAERTLNDFGARLRREVDLEVLTTDLVNVVDSTINPSQASLWLATEARESGGGDSR